jgi:predicted site-specific integrase-resolvase
MTEIKRELESLRSKLYQRVKEINQQIEILESEKKAKDEMIWKLGSIVTLIKEKENGVQS